MHSTHCPEHQPCASIPGHWGVKLQPWKFPLLGWEQTLIFKYPWYSWQINLLPLTNYQKKKPTMVLQKVKLHITNSKAILFVWAPSFFFRQVMCSPLTKVARGTGCWNELNYLMQCVPQLWEFNFLSSLRAGWVTQSYRTESHLIQVRKLWEQSIRRSPEGSFLGGGVLTLLSLTQFRLILPPPVPTPLSFAREMLKIYRCSLKSLDIWLSFTLLKYGMHVICAANHWSLTVISWESFLDPWIVTAFQEKAKETPLDRYPRT